MADRYWVGGTGTWNTASTTNWSATSGGAGGASVPTLADNVIFNSASSATAYTVTLDVGSLNCLNLTVGPPTSGAVTLSGSGHTLSIYGNLTIGSTTVIQSFGDFYLRSTTASSIAVSNSVLFTNFNFEGTGTFTLTTALLIAGAGIFHNAGTLVANGFNITADGYTVTPTSATTLNLSSNSIVNITGFPGLVLNDALTINYGGGTGKFYFNSISYGILAKSYNNNASTLRLEAAPATTQVIIDVVTTTIIEYLIVPSPSATSCNVSLPPGNLTIQTLTLGTVAAPLDRRIAVYCITNGGNTNLINATAATLNNVDFTGINFSVARSGNSIGNAGGNNTNITFTAAKTVYWNNTAGGSISTNGNNYAATAGGAVSLANYPLPQDTLIFYDAGIAIGTTVSFSGQMRGAPGIDASGLTRAITFQISAATYNPNYTAFCGPVFNVPTNIAITFQIGDRLWFPSTTSITFSRNTVNLATVYGANVTFTQNTALATLYASNGIINLNGKSITLSNQLNFTDTFTSPAYGRTFDFTSGGVINVINNTGGNTTVVTGPGSSTTVLGTTKPIVLQTNVASSNQTINIFDSFSGTNAFSYYILTSGAGTTYAFTASACRFQDFDCTGFLGTVTLLGAPTTIYGNFVLTSALTLAVSVPDLSFVGLTGTTQTITPAGKALGNLTFGASGSTETPNYLLTSAVTCSSITINTGTLQLNNFTHTITATTSSFSFGTAAQTGPTVIDWGSTGSVVALTSAPASFTNIRTSQNNCTFSGAGTKTINFTSTVAGTRTCVPTVNLANAETQAPSVNFTGVTTSNSSIVLSSALGSTYFKTVTFATGALYTWNNATGINDINLYGSLELTAAMTLNFNGVITFQNTSGTALLKTNGKTLGFAIGRNGLGGTTQMQDALVSTSTQTTPFFVTAGTWDFNNFNVTARSFTSSGTLNRQLAFGTGSLNLTNTSTVTIINIVSGGTGFSVSGTPTVNLSGAATSSTRTIAALGTPEAASLIINVTAGGSGSTVNLNGSRFRSLNFTGFSGIVTGAPSYTLYGSLNLSGASSFDASGAITFAHTSGTAIITSAGKQLNCAVTINSPGGTTQMADAANIADVGTGLTLTAGTFNLNNFTLTLNCLTSAGTLARTLAFGTTGAISMPVPSGATLVNISNGANFTATGSKNINVTGNISFGIRDFSCTDVTEAGSLKINVSAGTSGTTVRFAQSAGNRYAALNLTGYTGTVTIVYSITLDGNLTIGSGATLTSTGAQYTWAHTSGTAVVSSAINLPVLVINCPGGTWQPSGTLNTDQTTFNAGTINLSTATWNCYKFISTNTGVARVFNFGTGNIYLSIGDEALWSVDTATNFSTSGTGIINLAPSFGTSATFAGGGATYPDIRFFTLKTFIITGNNTFANFGNAAAFRTVVLAAGSTQTITNFNLAGTAGTAGNLTTFRSQTLGTQATITKPSGTVTASYLSIRDINATGGATWNASNGTNTNVSNNTGWVFAVVVAALASAFFNFF